MNRLQLLREAHGKSKVQLSYDSRVPAPVIGWCESGRFRAYPVQLERLAEALGYDGPPESLLDPVPADK